MSMKKILMAAAAVTALTAGVANAAKLDISSTGSKVSTVFLDNLTSATTGVAEAYSLPSELVQSSTDQINAKLVFAPSAGAIPAGTYNVTWNVSGGTFASAVPAFTGVDAAGATATVVGALVSQTSTSITATYTVTGTSTVAGFIMTQPILVGTAKTPVSVSGNIATQGGTAIDGGAIAAQTIIDYRPGYKIQATAANPKLSLNSSFKAFTGPATSANIATAFGIVPNINPAPTVSNTDTLYKDYVAGVLDTAPITSAKLTVSGATSTWKLQLQDTGGTPQIVGADTGTTDTITVNTGAAFTAFKAGSAIVSLAQKTTPEVGAESAYSVATVVTVAPTGNIITAPTLSPKTLGSVTYEGTSIYAPWVGDGTNGISYTIRLSNSSATTAIPFVQARLTSPFVTGTSGTVASTATCTVGTVPASGELLVSSATLQACFGNFKRADVTLIVGSSAAPAATTAKMRATAVNGTVSEVMLGKGVVGEAASTTVANIYN